MPAPITLPVGADLSKFERDIADAYRRIETRKYALKFDSSQFKIGGLTRDVQTFDRELGRASNRVLAFASAGAVFYTFQRGLSELVRTTVEVDKGLARIGVNLNLTTEAFKRFGSAVFETARQTGATFEEAAKGAEELARQGLSVEETQRRLKDALTLSRIAGISTAESVEGITAAINTFNKEALTSTEIVAKLAAVDTRYAVSSKDLAEAISRVGNSAQEAGVDFDQLLAVVTSVQQTTQRGGAVIGNSLKTIFQRVARPEALDDLQKLGIAVRDVSGNALPAIQILKNLSDTYDTLSQAQKTFIAEQLGGVYQINILRAAVSDLGKEYSTYEGALNAASGATDEAIRKNEQLNQSLSSVINSIQLSFKQLGSAVGNQTASPLIKQLASGIDSIKNALSGSQATDIGKTLGEGIIQGLSNSLLVGGAAIAFVIGKSLSKVIKSFSADLRALIGINDLTQQRAQALERVNVLLNQATAAERAQIQAAGTLTAQAQAYLQIQQRITAEIERGALAGSGLADALITGGLMRRGRRAANGYVTEAMGAEQAAISAGVGGASSGAKAMFVPNVAGGIVANTDEYVTPRGAIYNQNMIAAAGLPAGSKRVGTAAGGYVPNYADGSAKSAAEIALGYSPNAPTTVYQAAIRRLVQQETALAAAFQQVTDKFSDQLKRTASTLNANAALAGMGSVLQQGPRAPRLTFEDAARELGRGFPNVDDSYAETFLRRSRGQFQYSRPIGPRDRRNEFSGAYTRDAYLQVRSEDRLEARLKNRPLEFAAATERQEALRERLQNEVRRVALARQSAASIPKFGFFGRAMRSPSFSIGSAIALPFLSGFIPEGAGGTSAGIAGGAASTGLQGAGLGAIFGPKGLLIGAAIGALGGALFKLKKSTEEVSAALENSAKAAGEQADTVQQALTALEALKEGGTSDVIAKRQAAFETLLNKIQDPTVRGTVGGGNIADITKSLDALRRLEEKARSTSDAGSALARGDFAGSIGPLANLLRQSGGANVLQRVTALQNTRLPNAIVPLGAQGLGPQQLANLSPEAKKRVDETKALLLEISPDLKDVDVNVGNINKVLETLQKSFEQMSKVTAAASKATPPIARLADLGRDAFLTRGQSVEEFQKVGLLGLRRTGPQPQTKYDRADATFNVLNSLVGSGAFSATDLEKESAFRQSRALVQRRNSLEAITAALESRYPTARYRDQRGNILESAVTQSANRLGNDLSVPIGLRTSMRLGANLLQRSAAGLTNEGLSNTGRSEIYGGRLSENSNDQIKELRDALSQATKATVGIVLKVDGAVKLVSQGLDNAALTDLAATVTATIGQTIEAQLKPKVSQLNSRVSALEGRPLPPSAPNVVPSAPGIAPSSSSVSRPLIIPLGAQGLGPRQLESLSRNR